MTNHYDEDKATYKNRIFALINIVITFEGVCPNLLFLAKACGTIRRAISTSDKISSRFKDRQNFNRMIAYHKSKGWFEYIYTESTKDYTSEIGLTIRMSKEIVEKRIASLAINKSLYDSSIEYKNAFIKANYDMMIKYNLGSSLEDPIIVVTKHFEDLGEIPEMYNKRMALFTNIIMIIHTELWNSILTDLGDSNMYFNTVDLRYNNLRTLSHNFRNINDNARKIDLRNNNIINLPCPELNQCVVDWNVHPLLSPNIQYDKIKYLKDHPIHFAMIQNYCPYPVEFRRIRQTDGGTIWRFVGNSYNSEALSDEECMKIICDIHENGEDINCSVVDTQIFRTYDPSIQDLQEIEIRLGTLRTDLRDYIQSR